MSIESYNTIRPVYYDVTLSIKEAKDEESLDMVDMILDSSTYIYETFLPPLSSAISSQNNTFASWYAGSESMFNAQLEKIIDFYS